MSSPSWAKILLEVGDPDTRLPAAEGTMFGVLETGSWTNGRLVMFGVLLTAVSKAAVTAAGQSSGSLLWQCLST